MSKLADPKLMKHIIDAVQARGVIGEEESITALTIKIMLRLVKNADPTSSNVLVSDRTGGGKDFLTKNVCEVLCSSERTYLHRTGLSPKTLNYWQPPDPDDPKIKMSWNGRVLYLEDPDEELIKSQAFKVMSSGECRTTTLNKDRIVVEHIIDGKPVMIVTSMKTQIDVEGQRRWDAVRVDTSNIVSRAVVDNVLLSATGEKRKKADEEFHRELESLMPYEVIIPWAMKLSPYVEDPDTISRTQVNKLLDYAKASAVLHQWQRQTDEDGRLIATWDDYELARCCFIYLRNKEGNALNRAEEGLLDYLRKHSEPRKITEIVTDLECMSKTWLFENKEDMIEKGLVSSITKFDPNSNREVEHLTPSSISKVVRKDMPPAFKLSKDVGYLGKGEFYREINSVRKQRGLYPVFKEMI
jgi:hypothetical protein